MNKFIIAGNWKMNTTANEGAVLVDSINLKLNEIKFNESGDLKILVCPPFVNISAVIEKAKVGKHKIYVGSQNCYHEKKGAFTGEVSIDMLNSIGCDHIIIGHSERRAIFSESDSFINKKLLAILESKLTPILCIGETLDERKSGNTFNVLKMQLDECLEGVDKSTITQIIVAYEPVWAIGTGVSATTAEVIEAHDWLRNYFVENYDALGQEVALLYGGSLNDANAPEILAVSNVNGGLIGGASLDAAKFVSIIRTACSLL